MPFEAKDIKYIDTSNGEWDKDEKEQTETVMFVWGVDGFGFGTTTFFYKDGKLKCDNETMSKEQIKMLMCAFVDKAEFID